MWRSRTDKKPPSTFWADFVAAVNVMFPGAQLPKETLRELYGLVLDEWREGRQVHVIVRQLCSCDGSTVVPSPAAAVRLGKTRRIARPPKDAEAGEVFGVGDLREPAALGRLVARHAILAARIRRESAKALTAKRQQEISRLTTEARELEAQIQAAHDAAFWKPPKPPKVPELAPSAERESPPATKRARAPGKKTRKKAAEQPQASTEPLTRSESVPPAQGFDDDIADDLVNELARRA